MNLGERHSMLLQNVGTQPKVTLCNNEEEYYLKVQSYHQSLLALLTINEV
jgi:hypothetical protein